jgi:peptide/nickel transport system permease protein
MYTYIAQRLLITIPLLLGLTFVIFMMIQIAPGDFFDQWALQPDLDQRQLRQWKREFGADKGWITQYVHWLRGVLFDVRFANERVRIGDFEYDTLAENRDAYDIQGDATPIHVRLRDEGSFALAFNFDTLKAAGVLGKTDNPNAASEHPSNYWSAADFQAMEMELRNDTAAGADVFLRVQDEAGKALIERRFIAAGASAPVTLSSADYARFGVDRHRLKGFTLFAQQYGGMPAELQAAWLAGDTQLANSRHTLDPGKRRVLLRNQFPNGLIDPGRCDRVEFTVSSPPVDDMTVHLGLQDTTGGAYETSIALSAGATRTVYLPFTDLQAAGVDTTRMGPISFRSDTPGSLRVDEIRLVEAGSGFSLGAPNFGKSIENRQPVWATMWPFLKNTILLNVFAILFTWVLALPIGIYSATHPYSLSDKVFGFMAYMGMAIPSFFFALLLLYATTLTYDLNPDHLFYELFPIGGLTSADYYELTRWERMMDIARHLVLPVVVLGTGAMAGLVRVLRAEFLDKSNMPFVVTARAKGLSNTVVNYKHVLRNALTPFVAGFGSLLPAMIGGSALVEIIFSYPGIGQLMLKAVRSYDIYLVMASSLVSGMLLVIGNLLADILLAWVDPRISYGR